MVSHGIFTAKFVRYSSGVWTVRWAEDWLVSKGVDLDNEVSGAKYSVPTLGTSVLMSSHLTQRLYASMTGTESVFLKYTFQFGFI